MGKRVTAFFETNDSVENAARLLADSGYSTEQISIITNKDITAGTPQSAAEATDGTSPVGGVMGTAAGLLLGLGIFAVPGLSYLAAAGPISDMIAGVQTGGLAASLAGFGFSDNHAQEYIGEIEKGNTFLSIDAGGETDKVRRLLETCGAYRTDIQ